MLKTVTPTLSHVSSTTRPVTVTTPTAQLVPTDATSLAAIDPTQELHVQNNYYSAVCIDDVLEPTNFDFSCSTPINIARLEQELPSHPDQVFVQNLLRDLSTGFNIGYTGPQQTRTVKNLLSVRNNPQVVKDYLLKEISLQHIAGPFKAPPLPNLQCSPIGLVSKDGSWRMIMDLSAPKGSSINDFISQEDFSVQYFHFDDVVNIVSSLGPGALMSKLDIKSAFRLCPVRPEDWELLGIHWEGHYFIELCLPFGLRSSPFHFVRLADALYFILSCNYLITFLTYYLDDFFTAGPRDPDQCFENMNIIIEVFKQLGIPLAPEKIVGPTTCIVYLGITIDSIRMEICLPEDKLQDLCVELKTWQECRKCTKKELQSLIGKLSFACKVIPSGRLFLRRLIDLCKTVKQQHHHVSLNSAARQDISWWQGFLPEWNGRSLIQAPDWSNASDLHIFTDASGNIGFGIYVKGSWIAHAWPTYFQNSRSIERKELFPIFVTCYIWGKEWGTLKILFHSDNQSVVDIWSRGSSTCPHISNLLRQIFFLTAQYSFSINIVHMPGHFNKISDLLSRLQIAKFRALVPEADENPTTIPPQVWNLC